MVPFTPSRAITRVRAASLRPSGFTAPSGLVRLDVGEPDFPTPAPIVSAAISALREGYTHYGDLNGDPELRQLVAAEASRISAAPVAATSILISHGGAGAITASVLAVVDAGDRVVIPEPTYSLYQDAVLLAGGEPVFVPTTTDHRLDLAALAATVGGARLVMLCNPVNPTGAVFGAGELQSLGRLLDGSDTLVLVDEAYAYLVYDGTRFASALAVANLRDRLILAQTLSKTFAMTGWRIGYAVAPPAVAGAIQHVHRTMNSSVNAAVQRAAITALTLGPALAEPMRTAYQRRRDYVVRRLAAIPGAGVHSPQGGFYAFVRYPGDGPAREVAQRLADGGVAVRAGTEFGPSGEGHVRLSFAADHMTLREGLARLDAVFRTL